VEEEEEEEGTATYYPTRQRRRRSELEAVRTMPPSRPRTCCDPPSLINAYAVHV